MLRIEHKGDNEIRYGRNRVYYINKKEKTVVCKLVKCKWDAIFFMHNKLGVDPSKMISLDRLYLSDSYVGKSTCHPEDHFDEKLGMQIAARRALNKYNAAKHSKLVLFEDLVLGKIQTELMNEETKTFNRAYLQNTILGCLGLSK